MIVKLRRFITDKKPLSNTQSILNFSSCPNDVIYSFQKNFNQGVLIVFLYHVPVISLSLRILTILI